MVINMKKYVIFDVDRTLIDSYKPELLSLQEAIETVLGRKLIEEECNRLTSLTTMEFFHSLDLSVYQIDLIIKDWARTIKNYSIECFPGIKEVIKILKSKGYVLGIITSRTIEEMHELDQELESIIDLFAVVVTSDKVKNPKPHKDSIDYVCKNLKCNPEDIIYVGDSTIDKLFCEKSGISFIPACWENKVLSREKNACFSPKDILDLV